MVDDIQLGARSGRVKSAADDISGVLHPRVKVQHGADGSATDVSTASPMPVQLTNAALTAAVHAITATINSSVIGDGLTALTPKYANFDGIAGDVSMVAAVTDKKIRLLAAFITYDAADGTIRFESAAGGTALSGLLEVGNDAPTILPFNPVGWLETAASAALSIEAVTTGASGFCTYVEV